jgi:hypothetical protein
MKIIVRDNLGNDVTNDREWYVNTDGKIFYYTGDIDGPLYVVDNDYIWEVESTESVVSNMFNKELNNWLDKALSEKLADIDRFVYFADKDKLKEHKADYNRIAEAVERTKKYIKE